jgi:hypothetical protein
MNKSSPKPTGAQAERRPVVVSDRLREVFNWLLCAEFSNSN